MRKYILLLSVFSMIPFALGQKGEGGIDTGAVNDARPGFTRDTTPSDSNRNVYMQGFDDITNMPGWVLQNNSNPLGSLGFFQGNTTVFNAQVGPDDSFLAGNFNSTTGSTGLISNWAITPVLEFISIDTFSFWTRTSLGSIYPDRLEVRLSTNGSSTNVGSGASDVGDFDTLLLSINPNLAVGGYPDAWTQFIINHDDLGAGTGRIAFRYYVDNAGPLADNSNFVGIDSVETTHRDSVPALNLMGQVFLVVVLLVASLILIRGKKS